MHVLLARVDESLGSLPTSQVIDASGALQPDTSVLIPATQTPWPHGGGLMKCFVRREHVNRGLGSLTGKLYRFTLWQGMGVKDKSARFMMCAVQRSK